MDKKCLQSLELNKVLSSVAEFAVTEDAKRLILSCDPSIELIEVKYRLDLTKECDKLLFKYGTGRIEQFSNVEDELNRANKGSVLSCAELLAAATLLRSARIAYTSISKVDDEEISLIKAISAKIYFNRSLEDEITEKIISQDDISDFASNRLYSIRTKIKNLNERIRSKLSEYSSGKDSEFLQDGIVTIRNDRYVVPVKAEHKNHVHGFIHDRSNTGSTFFIEPEDILELNNELIALKLDEKEEIELILKDLSGKLKAICEPLIKDIYILAEIDSFYARAEYGYSLKCTYPKINDKGIINIIKGKHPLIDSKKAVPVTVSLGTDYRFLLLSGANTGGKTVTLKMIGLFCLMAACGLFIPASEGSSVSVFESIYVDIGDNQSIEESLSTFSSHITNIIDICANANGKSLILIDELGGGTDPDEGQALAKAILKYLLDCGAVGVITTHFTSLKEFAYSFEGIENASMEFDSNTLKPLYSIKIGMPGLSNALAISRRLGMNEEILALAESFLSEGARSFENIVRKAEDTRQAAEKTLSEANILKLEWQQKVDKINLQIDELNREKEKINRSARSESRRIIAERTEQAEDYLRKIEEIFKKEELTESDLIAARTLKNKMQNIAFDEESEKKKVNEYLPATEQNIKCGATVYIKPMDTRGQVVSYNAKRGEAEILCGSIKMHLKLKDLLIINDIIQQTPKAVKVIKSLPKEMQLLEINVLGYNVVEALYEIDNFIDKALTDNLSEIKIIHGVGTGTLRKAISDHLKKHRNVESFRSGKYGEGETGVTFVKLK